MRQWIRKYSWTPTRNSELESTPGHSSATVNLNILLDTRVTVIFQGAFQPSAGLSYWKIGTRQMCMKWLLIIRHVNSVEQCLQWQQCQQFMRGATSISDDLVFCGHLYFCLSLLVPCQKLFAGSALPLVSPGFLMFLPQYWWYVVIKRSQRNHFKWRRLE